LGEPLAKCKLEDLRDRVQRGAYRPLPSRRVYIPKPDGRQRPLAVAALEDKIVQRAVVTLLNAIYEEDFLGISYGFRAGRGTHDALDALCVGIHSKKVSFILKLNLTEVSWSPRRIASRGGARSGRGGEAPRLGASERVRRVGTPAGETTSPFLRNSLATRSCL
jgi:hypothetical protein